MSLRRRTCLIAALLLAVAVAPVARAGTTPAPAAVSIPDPMAVGPHAVYQTDYDAGMTEVGSIASNIVIPQELDGDLFIPQGLTKPAPVIAFLHGRHATCEIGAGTPIDDDELLSPCPDVDVV